MKPFDPVVHSHSGNPAGHISGDLWSICVWSDTTLIQKGEVLLDQPRTETEAGRSR